MSEEHSQELGVLGARVHVLEAGQGDPVLFLHGIPNNSWQWRGLFQELRARHRCMALDFPGYGLSVAPEGFDYSLEGMERFLGAFVEASGLPRPFSLVMHDIGVPWGLPWAMAHPESLSRVLIFNAPFFSDFRWPFPSFIWRTPVVGDLAIASASWPAYRWLVRRGSPGLPMELFRRDYSLFTRATQRTILNTYRSTDVRGFRRWEGEPLEQFASRVPTRVIWGRHDPYFPLSFAERYGTRDVVYVDCGHFPMLERPAEVGRHAREFLA